MSRDIAVIGAGANGLTCAHLLARAGHRVTVLEQRAAPPAGVESGTVLPAVAAALGVSPQVELPDPWISARTDSGLLELFQDPRRSAESIRRLSGRDAERWPAFCDRLHKLAQVLESLSAMPAPDIMSTSPGELLALAKLGLKARGFGREVLIDLLRTLPMPVADFLDEWFESQPLKAVLAGGGVMHQCHGPRSGGTTFVLLHHHIGCPIGVFRQPRTNLRALLAERAGTAPAPAVRYATRVERILVQAGRVRGVVANGGELPADIVVSGADPRATFIGMLEPGTLAPEFSLAVRNIRCRGVAARVTLTLDGPAGFAPVFDGASIDALERAYDATKYARMSDRPWVEARTEGALVEAHVQYVPATLTDWDDDARRRLGDVVVAALERQVPGIGRRVRGIEVVGPADMAREGLTEGQAYHAELGLDQILFMRPVAGWSRYATPIRGLFLCGAGTHPGGALAGASGAAASREILRRMRES